MQTELTKEVERAARLLKAGEVVAFPTETVYGLGGRLGSEGALEKIFRVKGRPRDNPLIVHIADLGQVESLAVSLEKSFFLLAERFWPGPLTLVVPKHPSISSLVSAGRPTIGLRMPAHPMARKLLRSVAEPIAAPSANLSGRPSPTRAEDVWEDLAGEIPLILDGGPCAGGIESTVLSLLAPVPVILRPGLVGEAIEEVLRCKVARAEKNTPQDAPGMKYRHYAPEVPVHLFFREEEVQGDFILSRKPIVGKRTHALSPQSLYGLLREGDRLQVKAVSIYCDEEVQLEPALMDRLLRCANIHAMCEFFSEGRAQSGGYAPAPPPLPRGPTETSQTGS